MPKIIDISVRPEYVDDTALQHRKVRSKAGLPPNSKHKIKLLRRSVDARQSQPVFRLRFEVYAPDEIIAEPAFLAHFKPLPERAKTVLIIGAGPAGYFAALECIEHGMRPCVIDRGKDVQTRRRDLRAIQQYGIVNPDSNYCFGEGGAGTYSDGKLYTRSHKRGSIAKALQLLVEHGANTDILVDAHPHIGSNKLPKIVANIRETIIHFGGAVHFNQRVNDFILENDEIRGVRCTSGDDFEGDAVILATGHSARDIFYLLDKYKIRLEHKPFALGVRIEHPQPLIDKIQYGHSPRQEGLPASSYKLTCQVDARGVFSFCMCPGGLVVPTATAPGEIVVNGMSLSRRDSPFANSGTVVAVEESDWNHLSEHGAFAGLQFQQTVEKMMFDAGDGTQAAPAQRLPDFIQGHLSTSLPNSSYIPGLFPAPLHKLLPGSIYKRLQRGVQIFGKKMKGYLSSEAVVIGTESRTSSPIRIPRDPHSLQHPQIQRLFPCGEGGGYAGGIISAALDGQNVAIAVKRFLDSKPSL